MNGSALDPGRLAEMLAAAGLDGARLHIAGLTPRARHARLDSGEPIYPASMIKTPLAVAAAVAVSAGRTGWEERLTVRSTHLTANDAPSPLALGVDATLAELTALMLARSDNIATNVLIDGLGREQATADLGALGFPNTGVRRMLSGALPLIDDPAATGRNTHPPAEACELFRRIAHEDVPGARRIEAILATQYWNGKLSAGLEPGDRFAHKTGDTDEVSHDGGILTLADGARYAIAVYAPIEASPETDGRFARFMRALRPLLDV